MVIKLIFRRKVNKEKNKKNETMVKMERVKGESHGTHFEAIGNLEKLQEYVLKNTGLENVVKFTEKPFANMGKQFIAAHLLELSDKLGILVITVMIKDKPELATAYPIYWSDESKSMNINKIYEWPIRIEANIESDIGDTTVSYFAADFFINREKYLAGEISEARIWIIGYTARVNPYKGVKIKVDDVGSFKELSMENAEILLPYRKSGVLDEYIISGRIERVDRIEALGTNLAIFELSNMPIGKIEVVIREERVKGPLKEGEIVEVAGWMEGMSFEPKWKTLR